MPSIIFSSVWHIQVPHETQNCYDMNSISLIELISHA